MYWSAWKTLKNQVETTEGRPRRAQAKKAKSTEKGKKKKKTNLEAKQIPQSVYSNLRKKKKEVPCQVWSM